MPPSSVRFLPLLALSGIVAAGEVPVPTEDQAWYYTIGGAEPVSIALEPGRGPPGPRCARLTDRQLQLRQLRHRQLGDELVLERGDQPAEHGDGAARGAIAALPPVRLSAGRAGSV